MAIFKKKTKEIKSDLHYKVRVTDEEITFDYQKNNYLKRSNRKKMKLAPGDWVEMTNIKNLEFSERKLLNKFHIFYLKKRSFFNLLMQIFLIVIYIFAYGYTIFELSGSGLKGASFIKNAILLAPLFILFGKSLKTLSKAITILGPNRTLKNKLIEFQSISFKDKRGKKRTVVLDREGEMIQDGKAVYHYGDAYKVSSNVYGFDLLILNKNEEPLYKVENYNVQIDFRQEEGILITKSKKLEHSIVELNEYALTKK